MVDKRIESVMAALSTAIEEASAVLSKVDHRTSVEISREFNHLAAPCIILATSFSIGWVMEFLSPTARTEGAGPAPCSDTMI